MWTAIGVGILVMAQAGAAPTAARPKSEAAVSATAAADETDTTATEAPATSAGADTTLRFRSDVGDAFQLSEARFSLDGRILPTLLTSVERGQDYVIFTGPIAPGRHVISSHLAYQSRSRSIFTYMSGYKFMLDNAHELNVGDGAPTTVTIVGKPNKGFNVPFERSLKVEMEQPTGVAGTGTRDVSTDLNGAR
jgi:hypothetical protein